MEVEPVRQGPLPPTMRSAGGPAPVSAVHERPRPLAGIVAERLPAGALTAPLGGATMARPMVLAGSSLATTSTTLPPMLSRADLRVVVGDVALTDWRLLLPVADGDRVVLGRGGAADVRLAHPTVSRLHLQITCRGGQYLVEDLRSTCGSRLNDQPLQGPTVLADGDRLRLGDIELVFGRGRAFPALPEPTSTDAPAVTAMPPATVADATAMAVRSSAETAADPIGPVAGAPVGSPFVPPPSGVAAIVRLRPVRRFPTDVVLAIAFVVVAVFALWSIGTDLFADGEGSR